MHREYKYRLNGHTWYWTMVHFAVFAALVAAIPFLFDGGYMIAWVASLLVAVVALMTLSIPRRMVLTDSAVEIRCVSDLTTLPYTDIASVRAVPSRRMYWFMPVFASSGFFGYYGYFLDLRRFDMVKVYASTWRNFVEITDVCEEKYYVSCNNAAEMVALVGSRINQVENPEPEDE